MLHSDWIPDFITAQSPRGLRLLMYKTNAIGGTQYKYFDISTYLENGKVKWIAWYYKPLKNIGDLDANAE